MSIRVQISRGWVLIILCHLSDIRGNRKSIWREWRHVRYETTHERSLIPDWLSERMKLTANRLIKLNSVINHSTHFHSPPRRIFIKHSQTYSAKNAHPLEFIPDADGVDGAVPFTPPWLVWSAGAECLWRYIRIFVVIWWNTRGIPSRYLITSRYCNNQLIRPSF